MKGKDQGGRESFMVSRRGENKADQGGWKKVANDEMLLRLRGKKLPLSLDISFSRNFTVDRLNWVNAIYVKNGNKDYATNFVRSSCIL